MTPFLSQRHLAHHLGVSIPQLRRIAENINVHYQEWKAVDPKKGKVRNLKVPDKKLKLVQQRILRQILDKYELPDAAHGGVRGKSPKTNAAQHCGKPLVVSMDIRNFYPSVSHRQVAKMFQREFGCGRETTWLLTRLTTIDGQLPQGAPTSTAIANIVLAIAVDLPSENIAGKRNLAVTRFVDDFAFSGTNARSLINSTARSVSALGLRVWRAPKKLEIMPASQRQIVTGLSVNSPDGPSVPRYKRDRIKTAIHQLPNLSPAEARKEIQSIRGRLNHLEQHNTGSAKRLRARFARTMQEIDQKGIAK